MLRVTAISVLVLGLEVGSSGLGVSTVQADTHYFCPDTSNFDWSREENWEDVQDCSGSVIGVPTSSDDVWIEAYRTCNVDIAEAEIDHVFVSAGSVLNIESGNKLILRGASDSDLRGSILLLGDSSELAIVNSSHVLGDSGGIGAIVGEHGEASISIADGLILTSEVAIQGKLKIIGLGTFINDGTVHASAAGTMLIVCGFIDDTINGTWKVSNMLGGSAAILEWNPGYSTRPLLGGYFEVATNGLFEIRGVGFHTAGRLVQKGGSIELDSSSTEVIFSKE